MRKIFIIIVILSLLVLTGCLPSYDNPEDCTYPIQLNYSSFEEAQASYYSPNCYAFGNNEYTNYTLCCNEFGEQRYEH